MRRKINTLGLATLITVITYGSLSTGTTASKGGLPVHFITYFILAAAFLATLHDTRKGHLEAIIASGIIALGLETAQLFIPGRTFSLIDFAVSFSGASLLTLDHHLGLVTRTVELEGRVLEKLVEK